MVETDFLDETLVTKVNGAEDAFSPVSLSTISSC
jgi:hypothetical protein